MDSIDLPGRLTQQWWLLGVNADTSHPVLWLNIPSKQTCFEPYDVFWLVCFALFCRYQHHLIVSFTSQFPLCTAHLSCPHLYQPAISSNLLTFIFSVNHPADVISTVEFNQTGDLLATGDKGGRVVIFQRETEVSLSCKFDMITILYTLEIEGHTISNFICFLYCPVQRGIRGVGGDRGLWGVQCLQHVPEPWAGLWLPEESGDWGENQQDQMAPPAECSTFPALHQWWDTSDTRRICVRYLMFIGSELIEFIGRAALKLTLMNFSLVFWFDCVDNWTGFIQTHCSLCIVCSFPGAWVTSFFFSFYTETKNMQVSCTGDTTVVCWWEFEFLTSSYVSRACSKLVTCPKFILFSPHRDW